jgi:hypothetical protein
VVRDAQGRGAVCRGNARSAGTGEGRGAGQVRAHRGGELQGEQKRVLNARHQNNNMVCLPTVRLTQDRRLLGVGTTQGVKAISRVCLDYSGEGTLTDLRQGNQTLNRSFIFLHPFWLTSR